MSLLSRIKPPGANGFGYTSSAEDVTRDLDLSSRTILLTGCTSGLGRETLRVLSQRHARVLGTARSEAAARTTCSELSQRAVPLACDLQSPASVRACVDLIRRSTSQLDAIVCNAGVMALPRLERAHGYELQFFTNHVGHFLLVTSLLDLLAEEGRVVVVSSNAHRRAPRAGIEFDNLSGHRGYDPWKAYAQSKLANLLFAVELSRRLPKRGQSANALHPGVIHTGIGRNLPPWARAGFRVLSPALKSVSQGAATQCYVAAHPGMQQSGEYFADCNPGAPSRLARDPALALRLWETSQRIIAEL